MLAKTGPEFKCGKDDIKCLCSDKNFGYGIHDCVLIACENNQEVANLLIEWGVRECKRYGVDVYIPAATVPVSKMFCGGAMDING